MLLAYTGDEQDVDTGDEQDVDLTFMWMLLAVAQAVAAASGDNAWSVEVVVAWKETNRFR
jgi:hypothetical protein